MQATTAALLVGLLMLPAAPALAHEGGDEPGEQSAEQHAADDLAGVPMSVIEAETSANRAALQADNPIPQAQGSEAAASKAATVDRSVVGAWGSLVTTPVVPVFSAVLPNGKVLMWDSVGDNGVETYSNQSFTRAAVWDPVTNTSRDVRLTGYNIFCAGFVQLPSGDVLVAGGNKNADQDGIVQTHLFRWRTETWTRGPDMAAGRWYPSVAALANGDALIVAGGPAKAEVYRPATTTAASDQGSLRTLIGFDSFALREYPFLLPRLDGKVEILGPEPALFSYDTAGSGTSAYDGQREGFDSTGNDIYYYRGYGSFAPYLPGKALVSGGGSNTPGIIASTASARVVDTTITPATGTATAAMAYPRRQHNLTILADGSVLATGGMNSNSDKDGNGGHPTVDLPNAVKVAERWNPTTGAWTTLSSAARIREYHSTAVLLPDGRVMTGGGGVCTACVDAGYLEKNVEYFSPPYLFGADGKPAVRPVLTAVPAQVDNAARFTVHSASAASIAKVGLVRLGADTHSVDQGQRYVPLSFSRSGSVLTATAPASGNVASPGYYMLFAVTKTGVPSKASIVHVGSVGVPAAATPAPAAASSSTTNSSSSRVSEPATVGTTSTPNPVAGVGTASTRPTTPPVAPCLQARAGTGPRGEVIRIVRADCNGAAEQTWQRRRADRTLRTVGRCLTLGTGTPAPGQTAQLVRCNGSAAQRVVLRRGSLSPARRPGLCVATATTELGSAARLQRCDGSPEQRFTF